MSTGKLFQTATDECLNGMVHAALPCSIEDAKRKAEYDKKLQMAEEKKASVRETIQMLREEFQKLIARNNELPPHLALNRKVSLPPPLF